MPITQSPDSDPPTAGELATALEGRHPGIRSAGRWLVVNPNLSGLPAVVSRRFESCAARLLQLVKVDDPELTRALTLLTQAKDAAVRAAIADQEVTGR